MHYYEINTINFSNCRITSWSCFKSIDCSHHDNNSTSKHTIR